MCPFSVFSAEKSRVRIQFDQVRELRNTQILGKSNNDNDDDVDIKDVVKKRKVFVDAANEYDDAGKADEDNEVVEKVL